jgi:polysaccharide deacetylase 2 family uncharacterized protein YibQ
MRVLIIKRWFIIALGGIFLLTGAFLYVINNVLPASSKSPVKGYIALIIDDFGNHGEGTEAILKLGIPITAAVMPFLDKSQSDAEIAHNAGLEVIMHVPMEPTSGDKNWLGAMGITCNLSTPEIQTRLLEGLAQIKWAVGMNNHMGSKAMQDKRIVRAVLEVAKSRNIFFIDSKTTDKTVAPDIVKDLNLPYFARDVFLDNAKMFNYISGQLKKLGDIALQRGYAIGIGHVGPEGGSITAKAIAAMYPILEKNGISFIYASQIGEVASYTKLHSKVNSD